MSILSEVFAYWNGNATLTGAVPYASVWTGVVPENQTFPYVVITPIALVPTPTTGTGYYENFTFQISIFDVSGDNVDSLASTIAGQFDYKQISAQTISCERASGPIFTVDTDTPQLTFHALLQYELRENKTLPAN